MNRLRVFAGPNGSGKSSLYDEFSKKYQTGFFVNADNIERDFRTKGFIDLKDFELNLTNSDFKSFLKSKNAQSLSKKGLLKEILKNEIEIIENVIVCKNKSSSGYIGALIAAFIRYFLVRSKKSFSFETVMSHSSKISDLKHAINLGFKTYLYFICTDDPQFNVSRVANRVEKGGHYVAQDKIKSRYIKSLENILPAVKYANKVYFFDNSGKQFKRIAEIKSGQLTINVEPISLPNWFIDYVLKFYI